MQNVLVLIPTDAEMRQKLISSAPNFDYRFIDDALFKPVLTEDDVAWANIILGNPKPDFIKASGKLLWLQTNSAGVEPFIKNGVLAESTALTNASGAYGLAIAEHMLGMHLEIIKKLELYRDNQSARKWESRGSVKSISGANVLVLGMGDIGGEYARRVKVLGATVIGMRRMNREKPDYVDEIITQDELDNFLPRADVIAMSLPGTPQTENIISRERIEKMKDGAVILNVGRGNAIDLEALADALESGKLMGAGLDVTEPEPLPQEHRLWKIPTAVITPHIAGFFYLKHTHDRIVEIMAENLCRFASGSDLINQVDFAAGYRKTQ